MQKGFLLLFFLPTFLFSQIRPAQRTLNIVKISEAPVIDGRIDDKVWEKIEMTNGFFQRFPADTSLASFQTQVQMAYDDKFIYLAATCFDKSQGDYVVQSMQRDFDGFGNDYFSVVIDPFNDLTNGFEFGVTPYGIQREGLVTQGGSVRNSTSYSWDNKWFSKVSTYSNRWEVEMAIPFSTLRYSEGSTSWRVNFLRNDYKNNERSNWGWIPRNFRSTTLAYTGVLQWDRPLQKPGLNLSIIPYLTGGVLQDFEQEEENAKDTKLTAGVGGDIKYSVTSSLNLDLTINPDFSQVEVDQQVTNLDRFEINFPERRQFFLENNDLFSNFGSRSVRPFFTRRIGIAKDTTTGDNIQNAIIAGARLSGKLNDKLRIGLLNMQTAEDQSLGIPGANYTVAVAQQQLKGASNFSALFVNKEQQVRAFSDTLEEYEPYNRVMGLDYNHISKDNVWTGKIFYHRSIRPGDNDKAFAHGANLFYNTMTWEAEWNHEIVGAGYDARVGFVRRTNYERITPRLEYKWYPNSDKINRLSVEVENDMLWASNQGLTDRETSVSFSVRPEGSGFYRIGYVNSYIKLLDDFDPTRTDGEELPEGTEYEMHGASIFFLSDLRKQFTWTARGYFGQFYNGVRYGASGELNLRAAPLGAFSLNYSINQVNLPDPYADATLLLFGPRINLYLANNLYFSTLIQYNNQIDNININTRLQWRFKPASDIFLVYTDNYYADHLRVKNRGIILKMTYWLNV